MSDIRVRFAPSPTGHVHIGNIRVCIYNWLFARNQGGTMLLRVEDTDQQRNTPEAIQTLLDCLDWLGLDFDEEPVYQSQRLERYREIAQQLIEGGHAYYSDKGDAEKGEALIFKVTEDAAYEDIILGARQKSKDDIADFVIMKSDNTPVFHLANVVDDIDMKVSHILRGNDHVESTYRHVMLYKALGATPPLYAHFPMIVNKDGKPYSKRDGDAYVGDFRAKGFFPDALVNFLALCGWSPGDDREFLPREELIKAFDVSRVRKSAGQFDMKKMENMNKRYIQSMPAAELVQAVTPAMQEAGYDMSRYSDEKQTELIELYRDKLTTLNEFPAKAGIFFNDEYDYDPKASAKFLEGDLGQAILEDVRTLLDNAEDFSEETLTPPFEKLMADREVGFGKIAQPIRVALTGSTVSPGIFETLNFFGRDEVMRRLTRTFDTFYKED